MFVLFDVLQAALAWRPLVVITEPQQALAIHQAQACPPRATQGVWVTLAVHQHSLAAWGHSPGIPQATGCHRSSRSMACLHARGNLLVSRTVYTGQL